MSRLMRLVQNHRIDQTPLFTHVFPLEEIEIAYKKLAGRENSVLKVAVKVS